MILNHIDQDHQGSNDHHWAKHGVQNLLASQGQCKDHQGGNDKHDCQVHAGKPPVVGGDVSQHFGKANGPPHEGDGIENENSGQVKD